MATARERLANRRARLHQQESEAAEVRNESFGTIVDPVSIGGLKSAPAPIDPPKSDERQGANNVESDPSLASHALLAHPVPSSSTDSPPAHPPRQDERQGAHSVEPSFAVDRQSSSDAHRNVGKDNLAPDSASGVAGSNNVEIDASPASHAFVAHPAPSGSAESHPTHPLRRDERQGTQSLELSFAAERQSSRAPTSPSGAAGSHPAPHSRSRSYPTNLSRSYERQVVDNVESDPSPASHALVAHPAPSISAERSLTHPPRRDERQGPQSVDQSFAADRQSSSDADRTAGKDNLAPTSASGAAGSHPAPHSRSKSHPTDLPKSVESHTLASVASAIDLFNFSWWPADTVAASGQDETMSSHPDEGSNDLKLQQIATESWAEFEKASCLKVEAEQSYAESEYLHTANENLKATLQELTTRFTSAKTEVDVLREELHSVRRLLEASKDARLNRVLLSFEALPEESATLARSKAYREGDDAYYRLYGRGAWIASSIFEEGDLESAFGSK